MYPARRVRIGLGAIRACFFYPWVPRERWELTFFEFDCGSQIDVDRSKRRCIICGMASRDHWVESVFCPECGKIGLADLSQMDDSFDSDVKTATNSKATRSNGHHQRVSVSVVACPRNHFCYNSLTVPV